MFSIRITLMDSQVTIPFGLTHKMRKTFLHFVREWNIIVGQVFPRELIYMYISLFSTFARLFMLLKEKPFNKPPLPGH